jgi:EAL domain-containing protein (putative c-di-GMP-specific phosphodiesterase class I)
MRSLALLVRLQLRLRRRYCKFGARPKIIGGIVGLGRSLGMKIVAEGAETPEEIAILREFRCDMVQGYPYARPAEAQEALAIAQCFEGHGHQTNMPQRSKFIHAG